MKQTTEAKLIASLRLASVSLMMEKIEQKIAYDGKSRRTRGDGGEGGFKDQTHSVHGRKTNFATMKT